MKVLAKTGWRGGFLDAHRAKGQTRVLVHGWAVLEELELTALPPSRGRAVLEYARAFGARATLSKVASRLTEVGAGASVAAVGFGEVLESDALEEGARVVFLAPRAPSCVERIVVDDSLMREVHDGPCAERMIGGSFGLFYWSSDVMRRVHGVSSPAWAGHFGGSGVSLEARDVEVWLDEAVALVARLEGADARRLEWSDEPVRERDAGVEPRTGAPTCVLLGHGHYARTCVLPTLSEALDVVAVHDIDPRALGVHTRAWARDTAGAPRPGKGADVWWIAGYHGGHAELAMRAIEEGAVAVVEKPLVTTHAQLDALLEVMRANPRARVHTGFHRRHGRWRAWLERDLGVGRGAPCDVFAIVHKTPLPPHHWYRWPASGGAMVANGCHWLDEFLGLNPGARVVEVDTREDALGRLTSRVELDNGALFTLSMSPRGSSRLGVRELVEYRVEGRSARLVDTRRYTSESGEGILRDEALDKHEPYALMVRAIAAAIRSGRGGEGADEIERTWRAVLAASS